MTVQVKICGITSSDDACVAAQAGADFIGVIVEINESPRSVPRETARRIISAVTAPVVLVVEKNHAEAVQMAEELHPFAIQLIGSTPYVEIEHLKTRIACRLWKTVQIPPPEHPNSHFSDLEEQINRYHAAGVDLVVLDTLVRCNGVVKKGGTGQTCDWQMAKKLIAGAPLPVFLAGGINPANVRAAIAAVHPQGVDVSSGVELSPGKKDPQKMVELIKVVHAG